MLLSTPENCCNGGEATFDSCVFSSIDIVDQVYGIYANYSSLDFRNCVFSDISSEYAPIHEPGDASGRDIIMS